MYWDRKKSQHNNKGTRPRHTTLHHETLPTDLLKLETAGRECLCRAAADTPRSAGGNPPASPPPRPSRRLASTEPAPLRQASSPQQGGRAGRTSTGADKRHGRSRRCRHRRAPRVSTHAGPGVGGGKTRGKKKKKKKADPHRRTLDRELPRRQSRQACPGVPARSRATPLGASVSKGAAHRAAQKVVTCHGAGRRRARPAPAAVPGQTLRGGTQHAPGGTSGCEAQRRNEAAS